MSKDRIATSDVESPPLLLRELGHGYRAEVGISEVYLIAHYARRPVGAARLAQELVRLHWPEDQALEFARIVARVCELAWTRVKAPR